MDSVIVNGETYYKKAEMKTAIVVLDRGFVVVGKIELSGNYLFIRNCHCVRRWGTKKGLGELASNGPQANTVLDSQPTTMVHELQVVQIIECAEEKWKL